MGDGEDSACDRGTPMANNICLGGVDSPILREALTAMASCANWETRAQSSAYSSSKTHFLDSLVIAS